MNDIINTILTQIQAIFNPEAMGIYLTNLFSKLIVGAIVLMTFYLVWLVVFAVLKLVFKRSGINEMTRTFLQTLIKYALLVMGLITALDSMGIKVSAVLASLGIAGLTLGFAAKDSLSNILAGVLIFLDRPFVIGDLVEIEGFYGKVDKITMRSTRIVTSNGKMLAVPNAEVINKTVASYTNFPNLRLDIPFTIAVTEDINRSRTLLLNLVNSKKEFLKTPSPRVVVTELNDYNTKIELQVWLEDERKHVEKRFELREEAFNALNQAKVEMPFETLSINPVEIKSD